MTAPDTPSREEMLALLSNGLRAADSLNRALLLHIGRRFPNDVPSAAVEKAMSEWEAARAKLPSYDECQRLAAKPADDGVRKATIEECAAVCEGTSWHADARINLSPTKACAVAIRALSTKANP